MNLNHGSSQSLSQSIFFPVALLDSSSLHLLFIVCTPCSVTAQLTTPTLQCSWNGIRAALGWMDTTGIFSGHFWSSELQKLFMWGVKLHSYVGLQKHLKCSGDRSLGSTSVTAPSTYIELLCDRETPKRNGVCSLWLPGKCFLCA